MENGYSLPKQDRVEMELLTRLFMRKVNTQSGVYLNGLTTECWGCLSKIKNGMY